jgi:hypothetical protein
MIDNIETYNTESQPTVIIDGDTAHVFGDVRVNDRTDLYEDHPTDADLLLAIKLRDGERRCAECGETFNLAEGGTDHDDTVDGPMCVPCEVLVYGAIQR